MNNFSESNSEYYFISYSCDEDCQKKHIKEATRNFQALLKESINISDIAPKSSVCSDTHVDISKVI